MTEPERDDRFSAAMMSVYYHSLGRQLELRGAPAVLLPPAVQPMPLTAALDIVKTKHVDRRREVMWTLLRSAPAPPVYRAEPTFDLRYSAPVQRFAVSQDFDLPGYDALRRDYRTTSSLFGAALSAFARKQKGAFEALRTAYREAEEERDRRGFADAVHDHGPLGGARPEKYLELLDTETEVPLGPDECAKGLAHLEEDVGMDLQTLVGGLSDAMAFLDVCAGSTLRQAADSALTAYPTAAVVVQDNQTLTTTVTVTTLVNACDLKTVTEALDPLNWKKYSDAFHRVFYVDTDGSRFTEIPAVAREPGIWDKARDVLLEERVRVPSGLNPSVIAEFRNILSLNFDWQPDVEAHRPCATLTYRLYRSIRSRYLWDARPGGILVDEGYIKIRWIARNAWRLTVRKVLRFADRTPQSWGDTPLQFGQSLNYLTPAALSWWLQSDMYNATTRHGRNGGDG